MSEKSISKDVKDFVFHSIDSAEQLDILLLLHSDTHKLVSIKEISDVLRSSPNSIEKRVINLLEQGLLVVVGEGASAKYAFHFQNESAFKIVTELAEIYKSHRYGILEIIFSPLKKSRDFADAFKITNPKDPTKGGRNG